MIFARFAPLIEKIGKLFGIVMLSGIVAAVVSVWLTDRANVQIENSKLAITREQKFIETFDAAHADVLAKLTLFNNDLLSGRRVDPSRRAEVIQALVKAQFAANDIEDSLLPNDKNLVEDYKHELTTIGEEVKIVEQPLALGGDIPIGVGSVTITR